MTTNALWSYLAGALAFVAAAFLVLAIQRTGRSRGRANNSRARTSEEVSADLAERGVDYLCAAMLMVLALISAAVSVARGGPGIGEPEGNTGGAVILISLITLCCVIVCLLARHLVLAHLRRRHNAQFGRPRR